MKTFKVDIPDDQIDFMLTLLDNLNIVYLEEIEEEKRTYLAKDYMIEKGLLPKTENQAGGEKELKRDTLDELRNAINRIQSSRTEPEEGISFRLPTSDATSKRSAFKNQNELKSHLESIFRIAIDHITYKPLTGKKAQNDDVFEVIAHVMDANSKMTTIKAGYSNKAFN